MISHVVLFRPRPTLTATERATLIDALRAAVSGIPTIQRATIGKRLLLNRPGYETLMTEDFEALCYQYAELGSAGPTVDFDGFQREVRNSLAPYLGLKVGEVNTSQVFSRRPSARSDSIIVPTARSIPCNVRI